MDSKVKITEYRLVKAYHCHQAPSSLVPAMFQLIHETIALLSKLCPL